MVLVVGGPKGQLFISDLLVFPWSEFLVAQKVNFSCLTFWLSHGPSFWWPKKVNF